MQIDWLTVAAQIVNFLVLVWLLQRFLYKPITNAMRRREARIEERLAEAKAARQDAEDKARDLDKERSDLAARKDAALQDARQEAEALRERLTADLRDEMADKRAAWHDHLMRERETFVASLKQRAGKKVLDITAGILADYADSDLNSRVAAMFAHRLAALDPETLEKMTDAAAQENARATIHLATAIDSAAKGRMTRAIHEVLSTDLPVSYREEPEMVLGVRLSVGDYSAEWSVLRYLKRLETELSEIIDAESRGTRAARDTSGQDARRSA